VIATQVETGPTCSTASPRLEANESIVKEQFQNAGVRLARSLIPRSEISQSGTYRVNRLRFAPIAVPIAFVRRFTHSPLVTVGVGLYHSKNQVSLC
jgi:hypothetical protein